MTDGEGTGSRIVVKATARSGSAPVEESLAAKLDRLVVAASSLAATIAQTTQIAENTVDVLTLAGVKPGMVDKAGTPDFISLAEAARRTGRHPDVLRRWCVEAKLPAIRVGRTWAISRETVAELASHSGRSRPRFKRA